MLPTEYCFHWRRWSCREMLSSGQKVIYRGIGYIAPGQRHQLLPSITESRTGLMIDIDKFTILIA